MDLEAGVEETGCLLSSSGSKNLLLCFSGSFALDKTEEPIGSDSDEIELGLSLGGSLNSVNSHNSRILRSSSIPAILPSEGPPLFLLPRTCSLPEEEIKSNKRKRDECMGAALASQASVVSQGSSSFRGSDLQSPPGRGLELPGFMHASEIRNPSRFLTVLEHKSPSPLSSKTPISIPNNGVAIINESVRNETVLIKNNNGGKCRNWSGELSKMIEEMPSVSAKGRGPNGRRIDGFLCKYGKGEEVSIVCVCHGSFLTPAEFVKHAGGGDVEHPLRHIVVNPSNAGASSAFL